MTFDALSIRLPAGLASFAPLFLLSLLAAAAWLDWTQRRIPNLLIVAGVVTAASIAMLSGFAGLTRMMMGIFAALFILIPVYSAGLMGAGDVKLLSMTGGFLGLHHFLFALLCIFVAGGLLVAIYFFRNPAVAQSSGVPYAVAVFGGVASYLAFFK